MHEQADGPNSRLSLSSISFRYSADWLFQDFTFGLDAPVTIIRGPNGCGKTTLLKLAAGLLKPELGTVAIDQSVAIVLQEDALFPWLTAAANLKLVGSQAAYRESVSELLDVISPLMQCRAGSLSYGQRRLVELCRVLGSSAGLICLDEPFNFLDAPARTLVARTITDLAGKGASFLIASHSEEDWAQWPDRVFSFETTAPARSLRRFEVTRCE